MAPRKNKNQQPLSRSPSSTRQLRPRKNLQTPNQNFCPPPELPPTNKRAASKPKQTKQSKKTKKNEENTLVAANESETEKGNVSTEAGGTIENNVEVERVTLDLNEAAQALEIQEDMVENVTISVCPPPELPPTNKRAASKPKQTKQTKQSKKTKKNEENTLVAANESETEKGNVSTEAGGTIENNVEVERVVLDLNEAAQALEIQEDMVCPPPELPPTNKRAASKPKQTKQTKQSKKTKKNEENTLVAANESETEKGNVSTEAGGTIENNVEVERVALDLNEAAQALEIPEDMVENVTISVYPPPELLPTNERAASKPKQTKQSKKTKKKEKKTNAKNTLVAANESTTIEGNVSTEGVGTIENNVEVERVTPDLNEAAQALEIPEDMGYSERGNSVEVERIAPDLNEAAQALEIPEDMGNSERGNSVVVESIAPDVNEAAQALEIPEDMGNSERENSVENLNNMKSQQGTIYVGDSIAEPSPERNDVTEHLQEPNINLEIDARIGYPPLPYVLHEIDLSRKACNKPLYINKSKNSNSRDPRIYHHQSTVTSETQINSSTTTVLSDPRNHPQYGQLRTPLPSSSQRIPTQSAYMCNNMKATSSSVMSSTYTVAATQCQQNPHDVLFYYLNLSPWYTRLEHSEKMKIQITLSYLLTAINKFEHVRQCYPGATFDIFTIDYAMNVLEIMFDLGLTVTPNGTIVEDPKSYLYGIRPPMTIMERDAAPSNHLRGSATMQQYVERGRERTTFHEDYSFFQRLMSPSAQCTVLASALSGMFDQSGASFYLDTPQPNGATARFDPGCDNLSRANTKENYNCNGRPCKPFATPVQHNNDCPHSSSYNQHYSNNNNNAHYSKPSSFSDSNSPSLSIATAVQHNNDCPHSSSHNQRCNNNSRYSKPSSYSDSNAPSLSIATPVQHNNDCPHSSSYNQRCSNNNSRYSKPSSYSDSNSPSRSIATPVQHNNDCPHSSSYNQHYSNNNNNNAHYSKPSSFSDSNSPSLSIATAVQHNNDCPHSSSYNQRFNNNSRYSKPSSYSDSNSPSLSIATPVQHNNDCSHSSSYNQRCSNNNSRYSKPSSYSDSNSPSLCSSPPSSSFSSAPRGRGRGRGGRGRGGYNRFNSRGEEGGNGGRGYGEGRDSSNWSSSSYNNQQRYNQDNNNRYNSNYNNSSRGKPSASASESSSRVQRSPLPLSPRTATGREGSPAHSSSPARQQLQSHPPSDEENWD